MRSKASLNSSREFTKGSEDGFVIRLYLVLLISDKKMQKDSLNFFTTLTKHSHGCSSAARPDAAAAARWIFHICITMIFFWSSVCWIRCGAWIWIHAWPPILHGPWPAMHMWWGGACLRTKALFGWSYLKFWIKEFCVNDILNKVYLQNFFIDECNLA
jgi:hypothetical protein